MWFPARLSLGLLGSKRIVFIGAERVQNPVSKFSHFRAFDQYESVNLTVDSAGELGHFPSPYFSAGCQRLVRWRGPDMSVSCGRFIDALWCSEHKANAWVWLRGSGWRKLDDRNPDSCTNLLAIAAACKANGWSVSVHEEVRGGQAAIAPGHVACASIAHALLEPRRRATRLTGTIDGYIVQAFECAVENS